MASCIAFFKSSRIVSKIHSCIICLEKGNEATVEHIVPKALGNVHYVLPKGKICLICNQRFARYEHQVLNSSLWIKERFKYRNGAVQASKEPGAMVVARFLLKIFYESLYHSRFSDFQNIDLSLIRLELIGRPVLDYKLHFERGINTGIHIPGWIDRWRLGKRGLSLRYFYSHPRLYFELVYKDLFSVIELSLDSQRQN